MNQYVPYRQGSDAARRYVFWSAAVLGIAYLAINAYLTQAVAAALHYYPTLSGHLFGHIYQPFAWVVWSSQWHAVRDHGTYLQIDWFWDRCKHISIIATLIVAGIEATGYFLFVKRSATDLHGSAAWADEDEIKRAGLL